MQPTDFLRAILPEQGYYALVGIKNKKVDQNLIDDLSAVDQAIQDATHFKEDLYFGCASFKTNESRKKENVQAIKAFWLDLDCGDGTAYETKQAGFDAVKTWVKTTQFPRPWVVDSGRGLHVYWPLLEPLLLPVWQSYADKLIDLCAKQGLRIKDPGCSTDAARILRVPDTFNYKDVQNPLPVKLLCSGIASAWLTFKTTMEAACNEVGINGFDSKHPVMQKRPMDALTARLAGNITSNFAKIVVEQQCAQITGAVFDQTACGEPLWRAVLSVAQVCEDRASAIHSASKRHPGYTPEATEKKADATNGPLSCKEFAKAGVPEWCDICKHKGMITGPVMLGKVLAKATPVLEGEVETAEEILPELVTLQSRLPELPFPYYRGKDGGIYKQGVKDLDGVVGDPQLIYQYDLHVVRRIDDPERGETVLISLTRPMDGTKDIMVPLASTQALDKLSAALGVAGVAAQKEQMTNIGRYITQSVTHLQAQYCTDPARTQMGWTAEKNIVWGRILITPKGTEYCPPAGRATTVANAMRSKGDLKIWEEIAAQYAKPGFELHACALFLAFGSMLTSYTREDPIWLHLVSADSGSGKSTLTKVMNSIWGEPDDLMLSKIDTANSVNKRRVIFNSMAMCQDEITGMESKELSQLAYGQSVVREKHRLTSSASEVVNVDRRNNIFITNGNSCVVDALGLLKTNASGELARLIEIHFPPLTEQLANDKHMGRVLQNYGLVGPLYAAWLVQHESELEQMVSEAKQRFQLDFKSISKERNWVGSTAAWLTAATILQEKMGIMKMFDIKALYDAWMRHMHSLRGTVAQQIVSHDHLLGDFINENHANILIPDSHTAAAIAASPATASLYGKKNEREARNKLVIRWEKDTRLLFVGYHELRAYCGKRHHPFAELMTYYKTHPQFKGLENKRLGGGTGVVSSPTRTLVFSVAGTIADSLGGVGEW